MTGKIESFLESNNIDYLFLLLANLEVHRLNSLPSAIKEQFGKKLTITALEHVAENYIPDYLVEDLPEEGAEADLDGFEEESPVT